VILVEERKVIREKLVENFLEKVGTKRKETEKKNGKAIEKENGKIEKNKFFQENAVENFLQSGYQICSYTNVKKHGIHRKVEYNYKMRKLNAKYLIIG
jgi:hypothetical protein